MASRKSSKILHLRLEVLRLAAEQMAALAAVLGQEVEVPAGDMTPCGYRPATRIRRRVPVCSREMEFSLTVRGFDERRAGRHLAGHAQVNLGEAAVEANREEQILRPAQAVQGGGQGID